MNRWIQILEGIEPEYQKLVEMLEVGPFIKPVITLNKRKKVVLTLQEVWSDTIIEATSKVLDEKVDWAEQELIKWSGVKRISYDSWQFDNKKTAEKFITLYYIQWTR